ncbi:MAG: hypothetical protein RLZZ77_2259 [Bacteroidota bacterium]|jgi:hypothetical protein
MPIVLTTFARMNWKKIYFFIIAYLLVSCEGDQSVRYVFTDLSLEHISSETGPNQTNDHLDQSSTTYGIRCNLSPVETYRKGRYFDPYESSISCDDPIQFIYITATSDFDLIHPEGSLLNDLFYYNPGNLRDAEYLNGDTVAPYFDMKHLPTYPDSNFPEYADFMLAEPITSSQNIAFIVRMITYSGTAFVDTTSTIQLH